MTEYMLDNSSMTSKFFQPIYDIIQLNEKEKVPKYKAWATRVIRRFLSKYLLPRLRLSENHRFSYKMPIWTIAFGTNSILTRRTAKEAEFVATIYIVSFDNIILYLQPKYEYSIRQHFHSLFQMFQFLYERIEITAYRYDLGPFQPDYESNPGFDYISNVSWYFGDLSVHTFSYVIDNFYFSLVNTESEEIIYKLLCAINDYYNRLDI
jgi:hypothetical protein